jgi:uncharacterized protein YfdQ (DUF2303 family)
MAECDFQAALDAGVQLAAIQKSESGREFIALPEGARIELLDELREFPARQKANVQVSELDSLIRYLKAFGGKTRIFAAINKIAGNASFVAVLDYHEGKEGKPGWCQHKVTFTASQTPEWKIWSGSNRKQMSQVQFAQFMEENVGDIVEPSGASMLEISKTLEAKTSVEFKSGIRLENGDHQLRYVTETTGRAGGNANLEIPAFFVLGLPPFDGGPAYKIQARLRYRIADGNLSLWYELVNPHKIIDAACKEMLTTVEHETSIVPFIGSLS